MTLPDLKGINPLTRVDTGFTAINVRSYGALGDGLIFDTCSTTASSTTFDITGASLTAADIGKLYDVNNVGAQTSLCGKILTVNSATSVTLDIKASSTGTARDLTIDLVVFTDGVSTAGSATVTSATAAFTSADVGKMVTVVNAGAKNIVGTIVSVNSATQFVGSVAASVTATGRRIIYGTNDRAAIVTAIAAGAFIYFPEGKYLIGSALTLTAAGKTFSGDGMYSSTLYQVGPKMLDTGSVFHLMDIVRPASGIRFEKLGFSGTNWHGQTNTFGTDSADGIYMDSVAGTGIIDGISVDACRFDSFWGIGFHPGASSDDPTSWIVNIDIENSRGELNSFSAFNPNVRRGLRFINNLGIRNGAQLIEASTSQATIIGNQAYYNQFGGYSIGGYQSSETSSTIAFIGNISEFNGNIGASISSNQINMLVEGNVLRRNNNAGLLFDNSGQTLGGPNCIVQGNLILSNGCARSPNETFGILNTSMPNTHIHNNLIKDEGLTGYSQDMGIRFTNGSATTPATVWGNDVSGHATADYYFHGNGTTLTVYFSDLNPTSVITLVDAVLVSPTVRVSNSSGTAQWALDQSAGATITIANNATATPFGNASNFAGEVLINDPTTTGATGKFLIGGFGAGAGVVLLGESMANSYSVVATTAARINVYLNSGVVTIENKLGASVTIRVFAIRMRIGP